MEDFLAQLARLEREDPSKAIAMLRARMRLGQLQTTYVLVPEEEDAGTYGNALGALRLAVPQTHLLAGVHPSIEIDGKLVPRPLTFKETISARVHQYLQHGKIIRNTIFSCGLHTCTAIAYKGGTTKFKIIPNCTLLAALPENFNQPFLPIDYDLLPGKEFDTKKVKCNTRLTEAEILTHPAWLAAVEGDADLLERYISIAVPLAVKNSFHFIPLEDVQQDQLRPLVLSFFSNSDARGNYSFTEGGRFVRVCPQ